LLPFIGARTIAPGGYFLKGKALEKGRQIARRMVVSTLSITQRPSVPKVKSPCNVRTTKKKAKHLENSLQSTQGSSFPTPSKQTKGSQVGFFRKHNTPGVVMGHPSGGKKPIKKQAGKRKREVVSEIQMGQCEIEHHPKEVLL